MGEVLGIKFEAIQFLFDLYEIDDVEEKRILFEKIRIFDIIRLRSKLNSSGTINGAKGKKSDKK